MENNEIIKRTQEHVKNVLGADNSGHDWWHIYRVWKTARYIAANEQADLFIVDLAALLHDIADWKFHDGDATIGSKSAKQWLSQFAMTEDNIKHVCTIIESVSFKGAGVKSTVTTLEAQIVQDADRLDAMGAIGIGRAFAYGGYADRKMYDPAIPPVTHQSFKTYKAHKGTTINHFYEKLLLLKDRMNTQTGKRLAQSKHQVMENFLKQFLMEWEADSEAQAPSYAQAECAINL